MLKFFSKSTLDVAHFVHFYWHYRFYTENTTRPLVGKSNSFQLADNQMFICEVIRMFMFRLVSWYSKYDTCLSVSLFSKLAPLFSKISPDFHKTITNWGAHILWHTERIKAKKNWQTWPSLAQSIKDLWSLKTMMRIFYWIFCHKIWPQCFLHHHLSFPYRGLWGLEW